MATICHFKGIEITMRPGGDLNLPHFYASYQGDEAAFDLEGELLSGALPEREHALVAAWAVLNAEDIDADWLSIVRNEAPWPIRPLC